MKRPAEEIIIPSKKFKNAAGQAHFSSQRFCSSLAKANSNTVIGLLSSFLDACDAFDGDKDGEKSEDVVLNLLKNFTSADIFFRWLDENESSEKRGVADKRSLITHVVFQTLERIFTRSSKNISEEIDDYLPLIRRLFSTLLTSYAVTICRQIGAFLHSKAYVEQTYKLLTAGVSLGANCVNEFLSSNLLQHSAFVDSARRHEFIPYHAKLLCSSLFFGDSESVFKIVETPRLLNNAIINLCRSPHRNSVILMVDFLSLIQRKLLEKNSESQQQNRNKQVSKTSLFTVFNPPALKALTTLFSVENILIREDEEKEEYFCDFLCEFFRRLTGRLKFYDSTYGTSGKNRNPNVACLLKFLTEYLPLEAVRKLIVDILAKRDFCPDQISFFAQALDRKLDPQHATASAHARGTWRILCRIFTDVFETVAKETWSIEENCAKEFIENLVPKSLIEKAVVGGLRFNDIEIFNDASALFSALCTCLRTLFSENENFTLPTLRAVLPNCLPSTTVLDAAWRVSNQLRKAGANPEISRTAVGNLIGIYLNYYRLMPWLSKSINAQRLLSDLDSEKMDDDDLYLDLLEFLIESTDGGDLAALTRPWNDRVSVVDRLIDMCGNEEENMALRSQKMLLRLLTKSEFLKPSEEELKMWFDRGLFMKKEEKENVSVKILTEIIRRALRNPYVYYEKMLGESYRKNLREISEKCKTVFVEISDEISGENFGENLIFDEEKFSIFVPIYFEVVRDHDYGFIDGFSSVFESILKNRNENFRKLLIRLAFKDFPAGEKWWKNMTKFILKNHFAEAPFMDFLREASAENSNFFGDLPTLIFGHSRFGEIMYEENNENEGKLSILKLLNVCVTMKNLHEAQVPMLLGAYGARLTPCDSVIVELLRKYEKEAGVDFAKFYPLVWGPAGLRSYATWKLLGPSLWNRPTPDEVLNCLDEDLMKTSCCRLPLKLTNDTTMDENCYDPRFLLPLFSNLLNFDSTIDCRRFLEKACLSFTLCCLSLHDLTLRGAAYTVLHRLRDRLRSRDMEKSKAKFRERAQIVHLLNVVRRSLEGELVRVPFLSSLFLARTVQVLLSSPSESIYASVNLYLLRKPKIDLWDAPEFYKLFQSPAIKRAERMWILRLLADGIKERRDYCLCERRNVFRLLLCFYDWATEYDFESNSREQILKILMSACAIRSAAADLCYRYNLIGWVSSKMNGVKFNSQDMKIYAEIFVYLHENVVENESTPAYVGASWYAAAIIFNQKLPAGEKRALEGLEKFYTCLEKAKNRFSI